MVDSILLYQAIKKNVPCSLYIHEYKFSSFFMRKQISLRVQRGATHGKYTRDTPKSQ